MKVELYNLVAEAVEATPDERADLESALRRLEREFPITETRTLGATDGFLSGLVPVLATEVEFVVVDRRQRPHNPAGPLLASLRPYQRDAVVVALRATRGLIEFPTGSGKTLIAVGLATAEPCRWLLVTQRRSVFLQLRAAMQKAGLHRGLHEDRPGVATATYQSLAHALERSPAKVRHALDMVDGVVSDEAHGVPAPSRARILASLPNAYWRFGLSATALDRTDRCDAFTVGLLGPVIAQAEIPELQATGHLASGVVRFHAFTHTVRPRLRDWSALYRAAVVDNAARNALVCDLAQAALKPCLLFVRERLHGIYLEQMLTDRGLRSQFVCGEDDDATRRVALDDLTSNRLDVLIATVIFEEGVDVPTLASVVVASGGKATIGALQRLGRALRPAPGKTHFELHDVHDVGIPALERHACARADAYRARGLTVHSPPMAASTGPARDGPTAASTPWTPHYETPWDLLFPALPPTTPEERRQGLWTVGVLVLVLLALVLLGS